jgi:hypothetical protein
MKNYNTVYYLLFVLLIMGAFSSMAQNSYGMTILGIVAISFGLVFLQQFILELGNKDQVDYLAVAETLSLCILSFIFALRLFHVYFPFSEIFFAAAGLVLIFVYGRKMILRYQHLKSTHSTLAYVVLIYHISILLFLVSLVIAPFFPEYNTYIGVTAFVLLLLFLMAGILGREMVIDGRNMTVFKKVAGFKDRSVILLSLFFIMSLYLGFTRAGIIPAMYSDDFPQAYFKLVNNAESGKEQPDNGKYRHQEFKQRYDEFLERNIRQAK